VSVAVVALALLAAAGWGAFATLVWRHIARVEGQAGTDAKTAASMRDLADQRDAQAIRAVQAETDLKATTATLTETAAQLEAAEDVLHEAAAKKLVGATDDHVVTVVGGMLADRRRAMSDRAARAGGDSPASDPTVPGPGT
jgi:hypothetical protein